MISKKKAAAEKKVATKKKAVNKKPAKKKAIAKKVVASKKAVRRKAVKKELTGVEIALEQSLQDPQLWSTAFPGVSIDHFLPKKKASIWVKNFNTNKKALGKGAFMQPSNIRKEIFLELLNRPEVKYLRFYFGLNEHKKIQVVFVGADVKHNDVYVIRKRNKKNVEQALMVQSSSTPPPPPPPEEEGGIDMSQGCPAYGSGETVMLPQ